MQLNDIVAPLPKANNIKTPAIRPVLAYTLYAAWKQQCNTERRELEQKAKQDLSHSDEDVEAEDLWKGFNKRRKLTTGCESIDRDALLGGLEYGRDGIVCLSVNAGMHAGEGRANLIGRDLAITFLATHLLENSTGSAYYIDSAGDFSPRDLQKALREKIRNTRKSPDFVHRGSYMYEPAQRTVDSGKEHEDPDDGGVENEVEAAMARVSVMRVFDIVGSLDAVGEINAMLFSRPLSGEPLQEDHDPPTSLEPDETTETHDQAVEIADSEASSNEDLLGEWPASPPLPHTSSPLPQQNISEAHRMHSGSGKDISVVSSPLLIVSSLPKLISPISRSSHTKGQAMLSHLIRALRHLSRTHKATALLLNSTVHARNTDASPSRKHGTQHHPSEDEEVGTSIFAAAGSARPALGSTLPFLTDVSLLVSRSTMAVSGDAGRPVSNMANDKQWTEVLVLEVLADRVGRRAGRWGMFSLP